MVPRTPLPWTASNPVTGARGMPRPAASSTTAPPRGCSEGFSRDAATHKSSSAVVSPRGYTSVTRGFPWVTVPVLSSTTVVTERRCSSPSADFTRMPCSAPFPVPTMMATGVARPRAQGQEITSTATPEVSARSMEPVASIHTPAVTRAMTITTGTNTPATLSASLAMGALEEAASSTSRIIWARVVSWPTRVARRVSTPDLLMEADMTVSPGPLSTGMDSPVRADSSTLDAPSTTTPSTGTEPPGRTSTRSPARTCSTGTSTSCPSRRTAAVLGVRSIRRAMACPVLPLERVSRYFPRVIRVRIIPADSKYRSME